MKRFLVLVLAIGFFTVHSLAQEKAASSDQQRVFKLVFALSELEGGKKINTRQYTVIQTEHSKATIKVGNRVPVVLGAFGASGPPSNQWQYIDVGFNLESRLLQETQEALYLALNIDVSGTIAPEQNSSTSQTNPMIRSMRQELQSAVPLGKPTVVTIIDDVNSKRTYQLEVTATAVK